MTAAKKIGTKPPYARMKKTKPMLMSGLLLSVTLLLASCTHAATPQDSAARHTITGTESAKLAVAGKATGLQIEMT